MRLFDPAHALHYCSRPIASGGGILQSLRSLHQTTRSGSLLAEGSARYDLHRANALAATERWLMYSACLYRRSIEMLVPALAPWAHVSLYYASYFSANAILAMHGAWVSSVRSRTIIVDVEAGAPGSQCLRVTSGSGAMSPNGARGSHRIFWDHYYGSASVLTAWVPPKMASAFQPVNGTYHWQTDARNEANYDMHQAWESSKLMATAFNPARLKSLSGPMAVQMEACEVLCRTAIHFAKAYKLDVGGLAGGGFDGDRSAITRRLTKQRPPSLLNQSKFDELVA